MAKGDLENLPDKSIEEVIVKLDRHEQLVYEKILVYSRTLFAQFLAQRAEKEHMFELYGGKYDKPSFLSNPSELIYLSSVAFPIIKVDTLIMIGAIGCFFKTKRRSSLKHRTNCWPCTLM